MFLWSSSQCSPQCGKSRSPAGATWCSEETLGGSERGDRGTYLISGLTISGSILEAIKIKRGIGGNLAAVGELSLGQPGQDRRSGQSDL